MTDPATLGTSIGLGVALLISEILPFIPSAPSGILQTLLVILTSCIKALQPPAKTAAPTCTVTTPPATQTSLCQHQSQSPHDFMGHDRRW